MARSLQLEYKFNGGSHVAARRIACPLNHLARSDHADCLQHSFYIIFVWASFAVLLLSAPQISKGLLRKSRVERSDGFQTSLGWSFATKSVVSPPRALANRSSHRRNIRQIKFFETFFKLVLHLEFFFWVFIAFHSWTVFFPSALIYFRGFFFFFALSEMYQRGHLISCRLVLS